MKQRILLLLVMICFVTLSQAQKKEKSPTGYAITGQQKGNNSWKEVRLVDIATGDELQTVYKSSQEIETLNARTGKPVTKKDHSINAPRMVNGKKVVNLDMEMVDKKPSTHTRVYTVDNQKHLEELKALGSVESIRKDGKNVIIMQSNSYSRVSSDKPFATNSAAMAYDKKHERLYYTPMSINQLRYIDLKAKTPKIYYFEDEPFGTMTPGTDYGKQITRMVIASDGNGYALTNDAKSLIRFTTGKNPVITDLGPLSDDPANGKYSVHSRGGYGGDVIADASGNIYLITANRNVFKFSIENKVAKYLGAIKGLPQGFSTNGAMVEDGSKVIVCSSESTVGYYRFDLTTLLAERVSGGGTVFNASDLANGNLAFDKKKKERKERPLEAKKEVPVEEEKAVAKQDLPVELTADNNIAVYPNPITEGGLVKIGFTDQPAGKYQIQLLDLGGKIVSTQEVIVNSNKQIAEFRLPSLVSAGTYLVKVFSEANKVSSVTKLIVQ